jgi:3-dehydroquinate synthetase
LTRSALESFELVHPGGVTRHLVGSGALAAAAATLEPELAGRGLFALSSRPILDLHGGRLERFLAAGTRHEIVEVPDGEGAKTVAVAEEVWRRLSRSGGRRDSRILAFGGGSVGDLAGFVAGAFLRGLDWLQLPTTLLAQVDASIGGKTAVDLPEAKNAVGLFHHPVAVVADTDLLATLTAAERRSGLVEAIKAAALLDPGLLDRIERDLARLLDGDADALAPVVAAAARAKADLVARDPDERGPRRLLNFGHTLGHAIEAELGYGAMPHGDAVAHGLRFALRLSVREGCDPGFARRLGALLDRLGVPPLPALSVDGLMRRMARDKKATAGGVAWVVARGPGRGDVVPGPPEEALRADLESWLGNPAPESL